jgi:hypothetical protein
MQLHMLVRASRLTAESATTNGPSALPTNHLGCNRTTIRPQPATQGEPQCRGVTEGCRTAATGAAPRLSLDDSLDACAPAQPVLLKTAVDTRKPFYVGKTGLKVARTQLFRTMLLYITAGIGTNGASASSKLTVFRQLETGRRTQIYPAWGCAVRAPIGAHANTAAVRALLQTPQWPSPAPLAAYCRGPRCRFNFNSCTCHNQAHPTSVLKYGIVVAVAQSTVLARWPVAEKMACSRPADFLLGSAQQSKPLWPAAVAGRAPGPLTCGNEQRWQPHSMNRVPNHHPIGSNRAWQHKTESTVVIQVCHTAVHGARV